MKHGLSVIGILCMLIASASIVYADDTGQDIQVKSVDEVIAQPIVPPIESVTVVDYDAFGDDSAGADSEYEINSEGEIVEPTVESRPETLEELNAGLPDGIQVISNSEFEATTTETEETEPTTEVSIEQAFQNYQHVISKISELESMDGGHHFRMSMIEKYLNSLGDDIVESVNRNEDNITATFAGGLTYVYTDDSTRSDAVQDVTADQTQDVEAEEQPPIQTDVPVEDNDEHLMSVLDRITLLFSLLCLGILLAVIVYVDCLFANSHNKKHRHTDVYDPYEDEDEGVTSAAQEKSKTTEDLSATRDNSPSNRKE